MKRIAMIFFFNDLFRELMRTHNYIPLAIHTPFPLKRGDDFCDATFHICNCSEIYFSLITKYQRPDSGDRASVI